MAPRSFLSAVLAALFALLVVVPADAQLRATAVREIADSEMHGEAAAAARDDGGFLVAWGIEGGVQLRALNAAGAPAGPVRTIVLGSKYVSASDTVPFTAPSPTAIATPTAAPAPSFAREARDRVAAAIVRSTRSTLKVTLSAPAAGRLDLRFLDARRRTVARRTVTYGTAGARTLTLRPDKAKSVSVRWTPKLGAPERAQRKLTRR